MRHRPRLLAIPLLLRAVEHRCKFFTINEMMTFVEHAASGIFAPGPPPPQRRPGGHHAVLAHGPPSSDRADARSGTGVGAENITTAVPAIETLEHRRRATRRTERGLSHCAMEGRYTAPLVSRRQRTLSRPRTWSSQPNDLSASMSMCPTFV